MEAFEYPGALVVVALVVAVPAIGHVPASVTVPVPVAVPIAVPLNGINPRLELERAIVLFLEAAGAGAITVDESALGICELDVVDGAVDGGYEVFEDTVAEDIVVEAD